MDDAVEDNYLVGLSSARWLDSSVIKAEFHRSVMDYFHGAREVVQWVPEVVYSLGSTRDDVQPLMT